MIVMWSTASRENYKITGNAKNVCLTTCSAMISYCGVDQWNSGGDTMLHKNINGWCSVQFPFLPLSKFLVIKWNLIKISITIWDTRNGEYLMYLRFQAVLFNS